jgi:hypothetical protein
VVRGTLYVVRVRSLGPGMSVKMKTSTQNALQFNETDSIIQKEVVDSFILKLETQFAVKNITGHYLTTFEIYI